MLQLGKWFKKHFIPHQHNQWKPHFLRHESILFVMFMVIILELGFLVQVLFVFDHTKFLASVLPGVLTSLTNEDRASYDLPPLKENELLTKAAQMKAQDMASKGYFAHTSPDGKSPWYWLNQVGYFYTSAGENLAVNFFESKDVSEAWMNSPTHKANIIKPNYTEIGIGVANGVYQGRNTVFVAQFFGTPVAFANDVSNKIISETLPKVNPLITKSNPTKPKTLPAKVEPKAPVETIQSEVAVLGEEIVNTSTNSSPSKIPHNNSKISGLRRIITEILSSPATSLSYIYVVIGILVFLVGILLVFVRTEREHPAMLLRGLSLMVVIFGLTYLNMQVLRLETKVPSDGITASVIAN